MKRWLNHIGMQGGEADFRVKSVCLSQGASA